MKEPIASEDWERRAKEYRAEREEQRDWVEQYKRERDEALARAERAEKQLHYAEHTGASCQMVAARLVEVEMECSAARVQRDAARADRDSVRADCDVLRAANAEWERQEKIARKRCEELEGALQDMMAAFAPVQGMGASIASEMRGDALRFARAALAGKERA